MAFKIVCHLERSGGDDPFEPAPRPAGRLPLFQVFNPLSAWGPSFVKLCRMGDERGIVLVTGATGYVGGRLAPRLLDEHWNVRCLVRDPARLAGRTWASRVEILRGDALRPETLAPALRGVRFAFYLVHGMAGGADFHERDLTAARNFGAAARAAGVELIVYLGGLGDPEADLSRHLRSRQETGAALRASGAPVTEFRAGVIVGSGSLSFEMIRYLAERVPVMVCPRWVRTRIQPIAIRNVLDYLCAVLDRPAAHGRVIEVGGAEVLTYGDMLTGYAEVRGLRRKLITVPVLTPRLSSYWVHLVTPVPATIARPLVEGLRNDVIVRDGAAQRFFPDVRPMGYRDAVRFALRQLDAGQVETRWSDALATSQGDVAPVVLSNIEGMITEQRQLVVPATPGAVFRSFSSLGGDVGWLYCNLAWRVRGLVDRIVGGVGLRRGRRDPHAVRVGDAVDFWRVEAVEPDHLLRLRAEMKLPGRAWLQFKVGPHPGGGALLTQTAFFAPKGLAGWTYWNMLYPAHAFIFNGLVRKIGRRALDLGDAGRTT